MPVIFEIDSRALNVGRFAILCILKQPIPSEALGFQMGLVFDTGKLEVLAVRSALPGFGPDNYHIQADRLAIGSTTMRQGSTCLLVVKYWKWMYVPGNL